MFKEKQLIPVTDTHLTTSGKQTDDNPICNAITDCLSEKNCGIQYTAYFCIIDEKVSIYKKENGGRIAELYTTTTLEDWLGNYFDNKKVAPITIKVFHQRDDNDQIEDERLWIDIVQHTDTQQDRIFLGYTHEDGKRVVYIANNDNQKIEKQLDINKSLAIRNHSPTGFNWGYEGSGPAQLALAILIELTGDAEIAQQHYQQFKSEVIAHLPNNWQMEYSKVKEWMQNA